MRRFLFAALVALACDGAGGGAKTETETKAESKVTGGGGAASGPENVGKATGARSFPAGAPPAQACQADADCSVAVDAPVGSDPCCNVTVTAMPIANRYLQFMNEWRAGHCAGVSCPPLSLPGAQPAPCGLTARCNRGTCDNTCAVSPDGTSPATP